MEIKLSDRERFLFFVLGIIGLMTTASYGFNEFPLLKKAALSLPIGLGYAIEDGGGLVHYINNKIHCVLLGFIISFAIIFQVKNRRYKDFINESNRMLMFFIVVPIIYCGAYYFNFICGFSA